MKSTTLRVRPVAHAAGRAALAVVRWLWTVAKLAARGFAWIVVSLAKWVFTGRLSEIGAKLGCIGVPLGIVTLVVGGLYAQMLYVATVSGDWPPLLWAFLVTPVVIVVAVLAGIGAKAPRRPEEAPVEAAPPPVGKDVRQLVQALSSAFPAVRAALREAPDTFTIHRGDQDPETGVRPWTLNLPYGVTASQLRRQPELIAHALEVDAEQVTVRQGKHPGVAVLHIAAEAPSKRTPPPWPLTSASSFDLTDGVPIGEDATNRAPVVLRLFSRDARGDLEGNHLLLTGLSGTGKSNALQVVLAGAVLDPRASVHVSVCKQTKDFNDLAPGLSTLLVDPEPEELQALLGHALAHMKTGGDGNPYLVVLDEAQAVLGEKSGHKAIKEAVRALLAAGRSAGIAVVIVTQEPTSTNLDPDLARRPQNRVSFRQAQDETARRAMGSGMSEHINPASFPAGAKGLCAVDGVDGFQGRVKVPMLAASVVAKAAKTHRRSRVSDEADLPHLEPEFPAYSPTTTSVVQDPPEAGQRPTVADDTIVDHALAVWPAVTDRIKAEHLGFLLIEHDPRYAGVDFRGELKVHGVESRPLKKLDATDPRRSVRGYLLADLEAVRGGVSP